MWWHCGIPVLKRQVFQGEHNCPLVVAAQNLCANRSSALAYFWRIKQTRFGTSIFNGFWPRLGLQIEALCCTSLLFVVNVLLKRSPLSSCGSPPKSEYLANGGVTHWKAFIFAHPQDRHLFQTHIHLNSKIHSPDKCQTFFLGLYKLQLSGTVEDCHSHKYAGEGMLLCLCVATDKVSTNTPLLF